MGKKVVALAVASFALCAESALAPGGWNPETRARLDALVERNRGNPDAYAVFDFDYTTAIGDLTYLCMWRALETLDFDTDGFAARMKEGVPSGFHAEIDSLAALAARLKPHAAKDAGALTGLAEWKDFARRFWALYRELSPALGERRLVMWRLRLFQGYAPGKMLELTKSAISDAQKRKGLWRDPVAATEKRGFAIAPEILDLFRELRAAGISVYIVSASVREMLLGATGAEFGLGMDGANVFGLELKRDGAGRYLAELAEGSVAPRHKPEFIMKNIAPRHHGAEPVLTAGDSMGDYTMLTEFKDLQLALVFMRNWRERTLHDLAKSGGRVVTQGRDETRGALIPEPVCIDPPEAD